MNNEVFTAEQIAQIKAIVHDELAHQAVAQPRAADVARSVQESLRRIAARSHTADMSPAALSASPDAAMSPE